ncbi:RlmE family RNA methyltransferase [Hirschia maritima]|uniref:RlmE family RNA methyltransferase n=1 Tax=Hirschia maritima TaxID=1121961 RepID=UPI000375B1EF|nr:RlmE family RNA methyltransferase [Hirschia maritima]
MTDKKTERSKTEDGKRRWKGPSAADAERAREKTFNTKKKIKKGGITKKSSRAWIERQLNDPYVRRAQEAGWRARAAYKLLDLDEKFGLLKNTQRVVDLGCAPGSWTQVLMQRGAHYVVGIDLLPVEPIAGAHLIEGDVNDPEAMKEMMSALQGKPTLVLSDMAAATTGHKQTDHIRTVQLAEMAVQFAINNLEIGGNFCTKVFQGGAQGDLKALMDENFADVRYWKPPSSRAGSPEMFAVALGFKQTKKR